MADDVSSRRMLPCLRLSRATLSYCPTEDRVRLDGCSSSSDTIRLWLTARLLIRLVPHVSALPVLAEQHFERPIKEQITAPAGGSAMTESVVIQSGSPEILVTTIDFKVGADHLELTYKDNLGAQLAMLTLSYSEVTLWNQGLRLCFEQAGWPLSVFDGVPNSEGPNTQFSAVTVH